MVLVMFFILPRVYVTFRNIITMLANSKSYIHRNHHLGGTCFHHKNMYQFLEDDNGKLYLFCVFFTSNPCFQACFSLTARNTVLKFPGEPRRKSEKKTKTCSQKHQEKASFQGFVCFVVFFFMVFFSCCFFRWWKVSSSPGPCVFFFCLGCFREEIWSYQPGL